MRVSDRFERPANLAPMTRQPGIVSRIFPKTIASPAPLAASARRRSDSRWLTGPRLLRAIRAQISGWSPRLLRLRIARSWLRRWAAAASWESRDISQSKSSRLMTSRSVGDGRLDRRRPGRAAQQRHLAEGLPRPELGQGMAIGAAALGHIDLAAGDDIEGIALLPGAKDDLARPPGCAARPAAGSRRCPRPADGAEARPGRAGG